MPSRGRNHRRNNRRSGGRQRRNEMDDEDLPELQAPKKVIVFYGCTGTGKTSTINTILEAQEGEVGSAGTACTYNPEFFHPRPTADFLHPDQALLDTAGFLDPGEFERDRFGTIDEFLDYHRVEQLCEILKHPNCQVQAIVMVVNVTNCRIMQAMQEVYSMVLQIFGPKTMEKIGFVVFTHWRYGKLADLERGDDQSMEQTIEIFERKLELAAKDADPTMRPPQLRYAFLDNNQIRTLRRTGHLDEESKEACYKAVHEFMEEIRKNDVHDMSHIKPIMKKRDHAKVKEKYDQFIKDARLKIQDFISKPGNVTLEDDQKSKEKFYEAIKEVKEAFEASPFFRDCAVSHEWEHPDGTGIVDKLFEDEWKTIFQTKITTLRDLAAQVDARNEADAARRLADAARDNADRAREDADRAREDAEGRVQDIQIEIDDMKNAEIQRQEEQEREDQEKANKKRKLLEQYNERKKQCTSSVTILKPVSRIVIGNQEHISTKKELNSYMKQAESFCRTANSFSNTTTVEAKCAAAWFSAGASTSFTIQNQSESGHSSGSKELKEMEDSEVIRRTIGDDQFALDYVQIKINCFKGYKGEKKFFAQAIGCICAVMDGHMLANLAARNNMHSSFQPILDTFELDDFKAISLEDLKKNMVADEIELVPFRLRVVRNFTKIFDDKGCGRRTAPEDCTMHAPSALKWFGAMISRGHEGCRCDQTLAITEVFDEDAIAQPSHFVTGWIRYKTPKVERQMCHAVAKKGYCVIGGGVVAGGSKMNGTNLLSSTLGTSDYPNMVTVKEKYCEKIPVDWQTWKYTGWTGWNYDAGSKITAFVVRMGNWLPPYPLWYTTCVRYAWKAAPPTGDDARLWTIKSDLLHKCLNI